MPKIQDLIRSSKIISEEKKDMYLALIRFLPEQRVEQVRKMLEKEANYKAQLQEAKKAEKSKANQEYIQEITITYKKEWKIAVKKEKTKESANANKLLDELNDL